MPSARKTQISLEATPYYHCVGRCVRRAFLWGIDSVSKRDYSHRKIWVLERLKQLSAVFSVDICAYAVMSNHYHLVLHVDTNRAKTWSDDEVAQRWGTLFSLPELVKNYINSERGDNPENRLALAILAQYRQRLSNLSWYMRCLNEPLARRANQEDGCTGRFWEGRFKSQAILDQAGLLACCAYVDLNPVRAGTAATPEEAEFTSIHQRLRQFSSLETALPTSQQDTQSTASSSTTTQTAGALALPPLQRFTNERNASPDIGLPYAWVDYLSLLDWTARIVRHDKEVPINQNIPPILIRMGFDEQDFIKLMQAQAMRQGTVIGQLDRLRAYATLLKKRCVRGVLMPPMWHAA